MVSFGDGEGRRRMKKQAWKTFLSVNLTVVGIPLAYLLLQKMIRLFSGGRWASGCLLHDLFGLYCPLCGGTRAVGALFRFRFADAFRYHPLVVLLAAGFLLLDVIAVIRIFRGKERLYPLPKRSWIPVLILLLAFCVFRNVQMIAYGIDPIGDLGGLWN